MVFLFNSGIYPIQEYKSEAGAYVQRRSERRENLIAGVGENPPFEEFMDGGVRRCSACFASTSLARQIAHAQKCNVYMARFQFNEEKTIASCKFCKWEYYAGILATNNTPNQLFNHVDYCTRYSFKLLHTNFLLLFRFPQDALLIVKYFDLLDSVSCRICKSYNITQPIWAKQGSAYYCEHLKNKHKKFPWNCYTFFTLLIIGYIILTN